MGRYILQRSFHRGSDTAHPPSRRKSASRHSAVAPAPAGQSIGRRAIVRPPFHLNRTRPASKGSGWDLRKSNDFSFLQAIDQNRAVIRSGDYRLSEITSGHLALAPVLSPTRITLENNTEIRPHPDPENAFAGASGGGNRACVEPSPVQISPARDHCEFLRAVEEQSFFDPWVRIR